MSGLNCERSVYFVCFVSAIYAILILFICIYSAPKHTDNTICFSLCCKTIAFTDVFYIIYIYMSSLLFFQLVLHKTIFVFFVLNSPFLYSKGKEQRQTISMRINMDCTYSHDRLTENSPTIKTNRNTTADNLS